MLDRSPFEHRTTGRRLNTEPQVTVWTQNRRSFVCLSRGIACTSCKWKIKPCSFWMFWQPRVPRHTDGGGGCCVWRKLRVISLLTVRVNIGGRYIVYCLPARYLASLNTSCQWESLYMCVLQLVIAWSVDLRSVDQSVGVLVVSFVVAHTNCARFSLIIQFSSVPRSIDCVVVGVWPGGGGRRREERFSREPLPVFPAGGLCEQFRCV